MSAHLLRPELPDFGSSAANTDDDEGRELFWYFMLRRLSNETAGQRIGVGVIRTLGVRARDGRARSYCFAMSLPILRFDPKSVRGLRERVRRTVAAPAAASDLMSGICVLVFLSLWYAEHATEMLRCASVSRQRRRNQITLVVRAFIFIECGRSGGAGVRGEYAYDVRIETNARRLEH